MKKTLIIIRHAHRDTEPDRTRDNGLSAKGKAQARSAGKLFRHRFPRSKPTLISSPKRRCIETLQPIATPKKFKIQISELLDEGTNLRARAQSFLSWWQTEGPELLVISSHGDWIPVFFGIAIGAEIDLKKGAWAELDLENSIVRLRWLLQTLS